MSEPEASYRELTKTTGSKSGAMGLDVCIVTAEPERVTALAQFFRNSGHRTILTSPARAPTGHEWECFDLVVLDRAPSGDYPEVPVKMIHHVVAVCEAEEIARPDVLRGALRAGARDLLPRTPDFHGWQPVIARTRAPRPEVSLRYVDPQTNEERRVELKEKDDVWIGRDPQNDIVLPLPFVSRRHARIRRSGSRYVIEDSESRHGTFVNQSAVTRHVLSDGDQVRLGGLRGPRVTFTHALVSDDTLQLLEGSGRFDTGAVNRQVHDIAGLLETFLSLNSDLVLDEILELVLMRSIEFVHADRGVILLRAMEETPLAQAPRHPLVLALARDRAGRSLGEHEVRISRKIPDEVVKTGKGVIFEDLQAEDEANQHAATASIGIRSAMCVPLKVRRDLRAREAGEGVSVIGVLYVDSESRGRPFSPRTFDALEVLASEVAMAIYSARLYEDSLKKHHMEQEMEIAREIQRNIFQKQLQRSPSWELCGTTEPSQEVGGDFLSCFSLSLDHMAVVVGDVSGKGVPAALYATMLEGLFHGLVSFQGRSDGLGAAVTELNRFLLSKSNRQKFVTSIFGFLEPEGRFTYVNAGHNPGLLLRAAGGCSELATSGTILGMFDDATYQSFVEECRPGDVLVLFSDGIPESRNVAGEAFGLENLKQAAAASRELAAEQIHRAVLREFHAFLRGTEPRDDVTLMIIRCVAS